MLSFLPPRTFTDLTVPHRPDGTALTACQQPDDYKRYVHWLADYLHDVRLTPSPDQQAWLEAKTPDADTVCFECSDSFGYALWELEAIQQTFEAGDEWNAYRECMHQAWLDDQDVPFDEWLDCDEALFNRLRAEWEQEQAAGQDWNHADIPFRPLLAWALKQMPDQSERIRAIDRFFANFNENASK